jgi:hypothetical protein
MDRNLPAARPEPVATDAEDHAPARRQPLSVAYLPLALVTFVVLAFIIAAWTLVSSAL